MGKQPKKPNFLMHTRGKKRRTYTESPESSAHAQGEFEEDSDEDMEEDVPGANEGGNDEGILPVDPALQYPEGMLPSSPLEAPAPRRTSPRLAARTLTQQPAQTSSWNENNEEALQPLPQTGEKRKQKAETKGEPSNKKTRTRGRPAEQGLRIQQPGEPNKQLESRTRMARTPAMEEKNRKQRERYHARKAANNQGENKTKQEEENKKKEEEEQRKQKAATEKKKAEQASKNKGKARSKPAAQVAEEDIARMETDDEVEITGQDPKPLPNAEVVANPPDSQMMTRSVIRRSDIIMAASEAPAGARIFDEEDVESDREVSAQEMSQLRTTRPVPEFQMTPAPTQPSARLRGPTSRPNPLSSLQPLKNTQYQSPYGDPYRLHQVAGPSSRFNPLNPSSSYGQDRRPEDLYFNEEHRRAVEGTPPPGQPADTYHPAESQEVVDSTTQDQQHDPEPAQEPAQQPARTIRSQFTTRLALFEALARNDPGTMSMLQKRRSDEITRALLRANGIEPAADGSHPPIPGLEEFLAQEPQPRDLSVGPPTGQLLAPTYAQPPPEDEIPGILSPDVNERANIPGFNNRAPDDNNPTMAPVDTAIDPALQYPEGMVPYSPPLIPGLGPYAGQDVDMTDADSPSGELDDNRINNLQQLQDWHGAAPQYPGPVLQPYNDPDVIDTTWTPWQGVPNVEANQLWGHISNPILPANTPEAHRMITGALNNTSNNPLLNMWTAGPHLNLDEYLEQDRQAFEAQVHQDPPRLQESGHGSMRPPPRPNRPDRPKKGTPKSAADKKKKVTKNTKRKR